MTARHPPGPPMTLGKTCAISACRLEPRQPLPEPEITRESPRERARRPLPLPWPGGPRGRLEVGAALRPLTHDALDHHGRDAREHGLGYWG
jgi:hypothetical protein